MDRSFSIEDGQSAKAELTLTYKCRSQAVLRWGRAVRHPDARQATRLLLHQVPHRAHPTCSKGWPAIESGTTL